MSQWLSGDKSSIVFKEKMLLLVQFSMLNRSKMKQKQKVDRIIEDGLMALGLDVQAIGYFQKEGRILHLRRGEHFMFAGERARMVGFVCQGALTGYYLDSKGNKRSSVFFTPRLRGVASDFPNFLSGEVSELNIEAIRDSLLLTCDSRCIQALRETSPSFERWYTLYLEDLYIRSVHMIRALQKPSTKACIHYLEQKSSDLFSEIPATHLANLLGIHRNTFIRLLRELHTT